MSDLIKREDLVKELNAQFAVGDITREIANDILNHIPSAEPERKKGRLKTVGFLTCQCSECGAQFHELEYTSFCPNCGVKWSE